MLWRVGDVVHVPSAEEFWKHVDKGVTALGCWLWQGGLMPKGATPRVLYEGVELQAWALAWQLVGRPVEPESVGIRQCPVPGCIAPDHWQLRYRFDELLNEERPAGERWRSHCDFGHPLAGANLCVSLVRGRRERICVACDRARKIRWRLRGRAKKGLSLPPLATLLEEIRTEHPVEIMRRYGLVSSQVEIYAKMARWSAEQDEA